MPARTPAKRKPRKQTKEKNETTGASTKETAGGGSSGDTCDTRRASRSADLRQILGHIGDLLNKDLREIVEACEGGDGAGRGAYLCVVQEIIRQLMAEADEKGVQRLAKLSHVLAEQRRAEAAVERALQRSAAASRRATGGAAESESVGGGADGEDDDTAVSRTLKRLRKVLPGIYGIYPPETPATPAGTEAADEKNCEAGS